MATAGTLLTCTLMVTAADVVRESLDTVTVSTVTEPAVPAGAVRVSELNA